MHSHVHYFTHRCNLDLRRISMPRIAPHINSGCSIARDSTYYVTHSHVHYFAHRCSVASRRMSMPRTAPHQIDVVIRGNPINTRCSIARDSTYYVMHSHVHYCTHRCSVALCRMSMPRTAPHQIDVVKRGNPINTRFSIARDSTYYVMDSHVHYFAHRFSVIC